MQPLKKATIQSRCSLKTTIQKIREELKEHKSKEQWLTQSLMFLQMASSPAKEPPSSKKQPVLQPGFSSQATTISPDVATSKMPVPPPKPMTPAVSPLKPPRKLHPAKSILINKASYRKPGTEKYTNNRRSVRFSESIEFFCRYEHGSESVSEENRAIPTPPPGPVAQAVKPAHVEKSATQQISIQLGPSQVSRSAEHINPSQQLKDLQIARKQIQAQDKPKSKSGGLPNAAGKYSELTAIQKMSQMIE